MGCVTGVIRLNAYAVLETVLAVWGGFWGKEGVRVRTQTIYTHSSKQW